MKKLLAVLVIVVLVFSAVPAAHSFGTIAITFDDSKKSVWEIARGIMDIDIPGTFFPIPSRIGDGDHMTWSQIRYMYNQRQWEVGNHTFSHIDLTGLTNAQIKTEILGAENFFVYQGLMTGRALALPFGAFNDRVINFLKSSGIVSSIRRVDEGYGGVNYPETFDRFAIKAFSVKRDTTFAQLKEGLDKAIANDGFFVVYIHKISWAPADEDTANAAVFKRFCAYIRQIQAMDQGHATTLSHGIAHIQLAKRSGH